MQNCKANVSLSTWTTNSSPSKSLSSSEKLLIIPESAWEIISICQEPKCCKAQTLCFIRYNAINVPASPAKKYKHESLESAITSLECAQRKEERCARQTVESLKMILLWRQKLMPESSITYLFCQVQLDSGRRRSPGSNHTRMHPCPVTAMRVWNNGACLHAKCSHICLHAHKLDCTCVLTWIAHQGQLPWHSQKSSKNYALCCQPVSSSLGFCKHQDIPIQHHHQANQGW